MNIRKYKKFKAKKTVVDARLGQCIKTFNMKKKTSIEQALLSDNSGNTDEPGNGHSPYPYGTMSKSNASYNEKFVKDANYLYKTNGYIARGVDTEASAMIRNGLELIPTNKSEKNKLDTLLQYNDIEVFVYNVARFAALYGCQFVEVYDNDSVDCAMFELLPADEMDYIRNAKGEVIYNDDGSPYGYIQWRDGDELNKWEGEEAKRIIEFKYKTLSGYVEGLSNLQAAIYPATEYGFVRSSLSDSFIRSLPVAHVSVENGTPEQLEDVTEAFEEKFTAQTVYVTSERFKFENTSPRNDVDVFKFIEPALSEIAACFHAPIELIAPTQYMKGDDFLDRYDEWIEYIKVKQKLLASILEHQVFPLLFNYPVKVRFNSPARVNQSELIKNVAFAQQSGLITPEIGLQILAKAGVFGNYNPTMDDLNSIRSVPQPAKIEQNKDTTEEKVQNSGRWVYTRE